jgi:Trk-type K+ transport system membrane component
LCVWFSTVNEIIIGKLCESFHSSCILNMKWHSKQFYPLRCQRIFTNVWIVWTTAVFCINYVREKNHFTYLLWQESIFKSSSRLTCCQFIDTCTMRSAGRIV